jgi:hypothetical protein
VNSRVETVREVIRALFGDAGLGVTFPLRLARTQLPHLSRFSKAANHRLVGIENRKERHLRDTANGAPDQGFSPCGIFWRLRPFQSEHHNSQEFSTVFLLPL